MKDERSAQLSLHPSSFILLFCALLSSVSLRGDAINDVRNAEIAFAKAFADRDADKFFSFVAKDAQFLLRNGKTLNGKEAIENRWGDLFKLKSAPFSWRPHHVAVTDNGRLGYSTGPVFDDAGIQVGVYTSIWEKQVDGNWKIMFDGPGSAPEVDEGFIPTPDGLKLHYRKLGHGGPTVIVPLEYHVWDEMSKLADHATVISYDLRARGRSSKTEAISIQNDVTDLETVRRFFNIDRFIPIGFSYLGLMVAMYTKEHPDRVERLVQVAPLAPERAERQIKPADDGSPPKELVEKREAMLKSGAIDSQPREFCEADAKVFAYFVVGDPSRADRIPIRCELENEWPKNVWHTFKLLMSSEPVTYTADDLAKLTAPVLIIHGTKDRNAAYAGGVAWSKIWPNANLVTIDGAAHGVLWEEPEKVMGAIRKFIAP
jgi:pimeloyl-ACP methyl ester carboxylesterase/ketosteroid isomerase-like protein